MFFFLIFITLPTQLKRVKRHLSYFSIISSPSPIYSYFCLFLFWFVFPSTKVKFSRQYNFVWDCVEGKKRTIHRRNWYQSQLSWHNNLKSEKPFFSTRTLHQSFLLSSSCSLLFIYLFFLFCSLLPYSWVVNRPLVMKPQ